MLTFEGLVLLTSRGKLYKISYVYGLVFLRLGVSNASRLGVSFLTSGG